MRQSSTEDISERLLYKTKTLLKKGTYTLSCENATNTIFSVWNINNTFSKEVVSSKNFNTFTFDEDVLVNIIIVGGDLLDNKIQLEEGSTVTAYEPYKSNILTVNEDVELRGIGDVKDTLDLTTGEVVERIGECVFDGSESIKMDYPNNLVDTLAFVITNTSNNNKDNGVIESNLFQGIDGNTYWNVDKEGIMSSSSGFKVRILKTKLNTVDINGVKQWLSQNSLTVQYQLATESVKTVDLTIIDEDNAECDLVPIMDTMHYQTSSDTIPPLADLTVCVEATTQNLASFVHLEGVGENE